MREFNFSFTVDAPLDKVVAFHYAPNALKRLTPPPMIMQVHRFDPLADGSIADFTMWLGPLPIRWTAVHSNVERDKQFTDTQQSGPMQHWVHTHSFTVLSENKTQVTEHIEYEYYPGVKGLFSRLLFAPPGLFGLFTYRKMATRFWVKRL